MLGYEALLADPAVDALYIPLPNSMHLEWAIRAAEARKPVLLEKPLALNFDEATKIVELFERRGEAGRAFRRRCRGGRRAGVSGVARGDGELLVRRFRQRLLQRHRPKGVIEAPRGIIQGLGTRLGEALIIQMDPDGRRTEDRSRMSTTID